MYIRINGIHKTYCMVPVHKLSMLIRLFLDESREWESTRHLCAIFFGFIFCISFVCSLVCSLILDLQFVHRQFCVKWIYENVNALARAHTVSRTWTVNFAASIKIIFVKKFHTTTCQVNNDFRSFKNYYCVRCIFFSCSLPKIMLNELFHTAKSEKAP